MTKFIDRAKDDIKLRNLTIYGQWLGIISAAFVVVSNLEWLTWIFFYTRGYFYSSGHWYILPLHLVDMIKLIFLPLAPFTVEMPYLFNQSPWPFRLSHAWFFVMPVMYVVEFLLDMNGARGYLNVVIPIEHLVFLWLLLMPIRRENSLMSVRARFFYYWAYMAITGYYAGQIKIGTFFIAPNNSGLFIQARNTWASNTAAVAFIVYGVAWWRGHPYVFSKLLGGPGVEPMMLLIPGMESRVDVVDEALEEGRIRLE